MQHLWQVHFVTLVKLPFSYYNAVSAFLFSNLLCLNLNGMNDGAKPKILPIGEGEHEAAMIEAVHTLSAEYHR